MAINIEEKKIIAIESDINKLISTIRQSDISGRVHIRGVGEDSRTDLPIY